MRPTDHLPPWRVSGDAGPAMSTLRSVIANLACVVRFTGIVYTAGQLAICHSFYAADPWRLAAPVAAMAWAAVVAFKLRRRSPTPLLACTDSAVYIVLALTAQGSVPPTIRGHAFSWLFLSLASQIIVPAWYAPAALSVLLVFASPVAYWIGTRQIGDPEIRVTLVTVILLLTIAATHLYGRRQLYGRAATADAALARADRAASEQYVILSRNVEQRERDRLLHDTVLNTLTALARAGSDDVATMVSRCRQDVALIEERLSDRGDMAASDAHVDLIGEVQAVAVAMRARGLDIHVDITGTPVVPATVATAITGATREALVNVVAHAQTGEAWIEVSCTAPD